MSKHISGPWSASQAPGGYYRTRWNVSASVYSRPGICDGRDSVAEVSAETEEVARANAHLIAAAPDLLDALTCFLKSIEGNHLTEGDLNQARAAIAKAEGRNE